MLYKSVDLELIPKEMNQLEIRYTLPIIWERVQDQAWKIYDAEDEDEVNEKLKELFDMIRLDVV